MLDYFIRSRVSFLSLAEKLEGAERELPCGPWVPAACHLSDRGARSPGTLVSVPPAAAHHDAGGSLHFISRSLAGWKSSGHSGAGEGNELGRVGSGVRVLVCLSGEQQFSRLHSRCRWPQGTRAVLPWWLESQQGTEPSALATVVPMCSGSACR